MFQFVLSLLAKALLFVLSLNPFPNHPPFDDGIEMPANWTVPFYPNLPPLPPSKPTFPSFSLFLRILVFGDVDESHFDDSEWALHHRLRTPAEISADFAAVQKHMAYLEMLANGQQLDVCLAPLYTPNLPVSVFEPVCFPVEAPDYCLTLSENNSAHRGTVYGLTSSFTPFAKSFSADLNVSIVESSTSDLNPISTIVLNIPSPTTYVVVPSPDTSTLLSRSADLPLTETDYKQLLEASVTIPALPSPTTNLGPSSNASNETPLSQLADSPLTATDYEQPQSTSTNSSGVDAGTCSWRFSVCVRHFEITVASKSCWAPLFILFAFVFLFACNLCHFFKAHAKSGNIDEQDSPSPEVQEEPAQLDKQDSPSPQVVLPNHEDLDFSPTSSSIPPSPDPLSHPPSVPGETNSSDVVAAPLAGPSRVPPKSPHCELSSIFEEDLWFEEDYSANKVAEEPWTAVASPAGARTPSCDLNVVGAPLAGPSRVPPKSPHCELSSIFEEDLFEEDSTDKVAEEPWTAVASPAGARTPSCDLDVVGVPLAGPSRVPPKSPHCKHSSIFEEDLWFEEDYTDKVAEEPWTAVASPAGARSIPTSPLCELSSTREELSPFDSDGANKVAKAPWTDVTNTTLHKRPGKKAKNTTDKGKQPSTEGLELQRPPQNQAGPSRQQPAQPQPQVVPGPWRTKKPSLYGNRPNQAHRSNVSHRLTSIEPEPRVRVVRRP
ncbi:hypothetical protein H0H93_014622 [Arthromyces matolae]|nr:hypothetical protein H0H93_014622 [Arthromyces matolae]